MISIITGDIIQSQKADLATIWLDPLKNMFSEIGETPHDWEIYRGDSFQLTAEPEESLRLAILIKSIIKKIKKPALDVRLAIGIGHAYQQENRVSESNDEPFVFSGKLLDEIKSRKVNMAIKTNWPEFDEEINMMLKLALIIMNSWTSNTAETAELLFRKPGITQVEIAEILGLAQSTVNDRIKRGSIYEIIELEQYYREKIMQRTGYRSGNRTYY
ncbi:MAG: winged helix-turn-helix domain-containing protein [Balneolaceae bacterium]|nr:MAG: winged helix-turn-helix domain-containing protein [Balneolaceae bacterium]